MWRWLAGFIDVGEEGCFGEFHEEDYLLPGDGGEVLVEMRWSSRVWMGTRVSRKQGSPLMRPLSIHTTVLMAAWTPVGMPMLEHVAVRWGYCLMGRERCVAQPCLRENREIREFADGGEVCLFEFGEVVENFGFRHAGGEPAEYVPDGDSEASNASLTGALPCFNCDPGIHVRGIAGTDSLKTRTAPEDRCRSRFYSGSLRRFLRLRLRARASFTRFFSPGFR